MPNALEKAPDSLVGNPLKALKNNSHDFAKSTAPETT